MLYMNRINLLLLNKYIQGGIHLNHEVLLKLKNNLISTHFQKYRIRYFIKRNNVQTRL